MYSTTKAIVISALKYGDNSLIVKCFTEDLGVRSYLLQGVLSLKKTTLKPALFQPFMQLELVASNRNTASLERIKEAKVTKVYQSIHTDIYKSSVTMFLAEICSFACANEYAEPDLYQFLEEKLCFFDENDFLPNFHLKFLIDLTRFLGFYPDTSNEDNLFFSLEEGIFIHSDETKHSISGKELIFFKNIISCEYSDLYEIKSSKNERNILLNHLLKYYQWHFPGFRKPKSLEVLQVLF
ncbi:DNA repair protein RecO [Capnocytophaga stomatis]|uniref:DNA repair protein RecO n=1 Tax=Capnocytophaga stomatis TaxID=1848904 RepID=UPI0038584884